MPSMKYDDEMIDNHFINLTTHEGKLTEKSFDDAREFLRSQEHDLEKELTLKLNEMQEAMAALDVLLANTVEKPSPLAKKAVEPDAPVGPTPADEPRAQPEKTEDETPAAPEAAAPEAAEAAKRSRGRPPGAPNKKKVGESDDEEGEELQPAKAGKLSAAALLALQHRMAKAEKRRANKNQEISDLKTEAKDLKTEAKELRGRLDEEMRKNGKLTEEVKQINNPTQDLKIENAVNKTKMQSLFYFIQKRFNSPLTPNSGASSFCETPDSMPMDRNMAAFFMGSGNFH